MSQHSLVFNQPSAWKGLETIYTQQIADVKPIKIIVEIGVDYGFSLFHFAEDFPEAIVVGVDDYNPVYAQHSNAAEWVNQFIGDFNNVILVKSNSVEAAKIIQCSVDLLHIDADHKYDAVRADFSAWEPKVRKGGCVMFHDTISFPNDIGRFFEELKGSKINFPLYNGLGFWFKQ